MVLLNQVTVKELSFLPGVVRQLPRAPKLPRARARGPAFHNINQIDKNVAQGL